MRKENFYTGEAIPDASPPFSTNEYTSEAEAIQNASFGKYDYDPGMRMMSQQPISIYPGGYGYNPNPYIPPIGLGSYPYNNYGYQGASYGSIMNPALMYQQQQYQQPQEVKYFVSPVNFSGSEYLPPMNYEEMIEELKLEYWMKEQDQAVKSSVQLQNAGYNLYGGYNNYYGVPFYNPYQYNSINSEISQKITEIQNEAKENRFSFQSFKWK